MKHKTLPTETNPFPKKMPDGRTLLDEVCECGHNRSTHFSTFLWGHGSCGAQGLTKESPCKCEKFSFATRVYK